MQHFQISVLYLKFLRRINRIFANLDEESVEPNMLDRDLTIPQFVNLENSYSNDSPSKMINSMSVPYSKD